MVEKYTPDRGDIIWVNFDPQKGKEQAGKRPALVISPALHNAKTNLTFVCPITSQVKNYPFEVLIKAKKIKGVVLVNQIKTIDWKARPIDFIEKISVSSLNEVLGKLRTLI